MTESWHYILVECMRGISWSVTYVAVCFHVQLVSPKGLAATTMGLMTGAMFGVGKLNCGLTSKSTH